MSTTIGQRIIKHRVLTCLNRWCTLVLFIICLFLFVDSVCVRDVFACPELSKVEAEVEIEKCLGRSRIRHSIKNMILSLRNDNYAHTIFSKAFK